MNILILSLSILISYSTATSSSELPQKDFVEFTLHNKSLKSIPLRIPGVMNPNLSPLSDSGVNLKLGQEIYFYPKGTKIGAKKRILLVVTKDLDGKTLDVAKLIKERKEALSI